MNETEYSMEKIDKVDLEDLPLLLSAIGMPSSPAENDGGFTRTELSPLHSVRAQHFTSSMGRAESRILTSGLFMQRIPQAPSPQ